MVNNRIYGLLIGTLSKDSIIPVLSWMSQNPKRQEYNLSLANNYFMAPFWLIFMFSLFCETRLVLFTHLMGHI